MSNAAEEAIREFARKTKQEIKEMSLSKLLIETIKYGDKLAGKKVLVAPEVDKHRWLLEELSVRLEKLENRVNGLWNDHAICR